MRPMLRAGSGGGCCECSEQTDPCGCAPCVLRCRSKSAVAELVGFSEFDGYASTPPRKFLRYTAAGEQEVCRYPNLSCTTPTYDYASISEPAGVSGSNGYFEIEAVTVGPGSQVNLHWYARVQGGTSVDSTMRVGVGAASSPTYLATSFGTGTSFLGEVVEVRGVLSQPAGTGLSVHIMRASFLAPYVTKVYTFVAPDLGASAEWEGACVVAPATGIITGGQTRTDRTAAIGCATLGPPVEVGLGCPDLDEPTPVPPYDAAHETIAANGDEVQIAAMPGCVLGEVWTGERSFVLSDEDTEDDAMTRVMAGAEWIVSPLPDSCTDITSFVTQRTTGFSFAFRRVQVQAMLTAPLPDATYRITFRYGERPEGVGGPFLYLGREDEVTVATDSDPATEEWSEYIDVPWERGLEISLMGCRVEQL